MKDEKNIICFFDYFNSECVIIIDGSCGLFCIGVLLLVCG